MFIKQYFRLTSIILFSLFLLSCGGGGGEGTPKVVEPQKAILTGTPALTVNENVEYSFTVTNQHFNGTLSYSIENIPLWANLDTVTGELSGTPNFEQAGVYSDIVISASDGTSTATLSAFSIDVINVNRLPIAVIQAEYEVLENELISIPLDISDPDSDDLTVILENQPLWLSFDVESSSLVGRASLDDSGNYVINILVNDGSDEVISVQTTLIVKDAVEVKGKVIDGYISGAIVYLDENINVVLDENEFSTITDETGSYTLLLPADKLQRLSQSPIRAYLGAGSQDLSRPELDFTNTPLTLSLSPIDTNKIENDIFLGAVVSPFSEQVIALISDKVLLAGAGVISEKELQDHIDEAKINITKQVISVGGITLNSNHSEESISAIIFGDFIENANDLVTIIEQAQRYIDLIIYSHDSFDFDSDGIVNSLDTDDDGDGYEDTIDAFPYDASEWLDTDGDGVGNNADTDDDGDSYDDTIDAFPYDASEWLDTDGDGVGDNADSYPNNASCFAVEDGNGEECYLSIIAENTSSFISVSSDEIVYFYQEDGTLVTFDVSTQHVLNTQQVDNVTSMLFHEGHQRLYIGLDDGQVKYLNEEYLLTDFSVVEQCVNALVDADSVLIVLDCRGYAGTYVTFNSSGEQLSETNNYYDSSRTNAWNRINNRLYHFRDGISPNDLYYRTISAAGEFVDVVESPYHGDYSISGPITISNDGTKVLLGGGDVYSADSLVWLTSIGESFSHAFWLVDGSLVTLHQSGNQENITLKRRNTDLDLVEIRHFTGSLQEVKALADRALLIIKDNDSLNFIDYLPSDDNDNDGVINTLDAFPLDSSASLDTDQDGFPDSWHDGFSESLTNLSLDEYPLDSACWLASHGNANGCDFLSTQPIFTPDKIISDDTGNIYFLSSVNKRIYRWLSITNQFTNPIVMSTNIYHDFGDSLTLTYSADHNRLYLGYSSGAITRFDLDELKEHRFANIGADVQGLASVGNFLLAENANGAWNTHYILDEDGEITDSKDWNRHSRTYAWNEENSRVYFLRDGTSPNDLHYETIDQTLGHITESGESPYHSSQNISHPVRVSVDGNYVILGSGAIYDADSLTLAADLELQSTDIISITNLIVSVENSDNTSILKIWQSDNFSLRTELNVTGTPLALAPNGDELNLITQLSNGALNVSAIGIIDADGDGLPLWWESLYNLDDNNAADAILDSDEDGLTNLEEFQNSTDPMNADSDNDGLSDFDEVNLYLSNPLSTDSDNDGMPDAWEVANNLDLLNGEDALLDADNDGITNIDEYLEQTDPRDENSMPEIIESLHISFENAVIPTDWVIDEAQDSIWGISAIESSNGDYSIFSSGSSSISYTKYFNGNNLTFDVKEACQYNGNISVYIDEELSEEFSFNESWQTLEVTIPRGRHTVSFNVNGCGVYLDNLQFTPLLDLYELGVQSVTVQDQKLHLYDFEQQHINSINIPVMDYNARDLTILNDGRIAVFNGVFSPSLSIYNPIHATWQHKSYEGWGIVNNGTYGGIAHLNHYVYVTDMTISGSNTAGIVRFNLDNNSEEFFSGGEYIDITVGEDNMLYALSGLQVDKYDPESMELLTSYAVSEARAVAVNENGTIFTASWNGVIKQYDAEGVERFQLILSDFYQSNVSLSFYDINVSTHNRLMLTNRNQQIFIVDNEFGSIELQNENFKGSFIAQVPIIDNDNDGMPRWWELKFGLNDNDETDALGDLDNDGLSNVKEFDHFTLPNDADTDDDGLPDIEEINGFYQTNPTNPDTDYDGLNDADELYTHRTNPLLMDTDGDLFSDGDEVNIYMTDPRDITSKPEAVSQLSNGFDSATIPNDWKDAQNSDAEWLIENIAENGEEANYALRSGDIEDNQVSSIIWENIFTNGVLSVDVKVSSESCCDRFVLFVNGEEAIDSTSSQWQTFTVEISSGQNSFEFRYEKDSSVSSGEDTVWVDNINFEGH